MPRVRIALAVGMMVAAAAVVVVLATPPTAVLATNSVPPGTALATQPRAVCQPGERLPKGTRAVRISLYAFTGPKVTLDVIAGERVLTSGQLAPGWSGASITIPVHPVPRASVADVRVCFAADTIGEPAEVYGSPSAATVAARTLEGEALPGRMSIQFMGAGHSSWLALAASVARHMALGRAWSGVWVVFLVVALMLAGAGVTARLVLRELR